LIQQERIERLFFKYLTRVHFNSLNHLFQDEVNLK